jgi:NitT/TauT family transport system permease protein
MSEMSLQTGAIASESTTTQRAASPRRWHERLISLAILVVIIGAWWAITASGAVAAYILPPPGEVLMWLVRGFSLPPSDEASLWYHLFITAEESLYGFIVGSVLGIVTGMALAHWQAAERVLYPFIVAFQALPKIAIAPLLVVWFGFGIEAKVITAAFLCFFPLLVNSMAGYHSVEPERIDLLRVAGATPLQIFRMVILPSSMPFIFAGLHMAAIIALLGAIVGEFVGARAGLGLLLLQYNNSMQMGGVFSILVLLGIIGFVLNYAMKWAEEYFCFWSRREKHF